jgi:hypothetical protein
MLTMQPDFCAIMGLAAACDDGDLVFEAHRISPLFCWKWLN